MKPLQILRPQKFDFLLIPLLFVSSLFLSACYLFIIPKINGYPSDFNESIQAVFGGTAFVIMSIYPLIIFLALTFFLIKFSILIKNQFIKATSLILVLSVIYYYIIQIFV